MLVFLRESCSLRFRRKGTWSRHGTLAKFGASWQTPRAEEAEAYLNTLMGVGEFVVEMGPDWYDRMPRLWFRISIEITEPLILAA